MAPLAPSRSVSPEPATETDDSKKRKAQIDEIEVDLSLPEPPSKKAKRLLKKGKPLPTKPTSDDEKEADDGLDVPSSKPKDKDGKEKSKRSEYGVWIGNLPFTLTRLDLFKWLTEQSGGAIQEANITRVNLPMSKLPPRPDFNDGAAADEKPKPQNRGFAYVDFDTEVAAMAAMSLTETELSGRNVLIKSSTNFEGRPQKEAEAVGGAAQAGTNGARAAKPGHEASRKVYVGNLAFQSTEDDLWAHFEKCGEIDWVKVATFEDTGKCKGYGWVKFKQVEAAEAAVRGWVKIKEEIPTEDDFRDSKEDKADEDEPKEEQKFKLRKWWVNRLRGRELKVEFAEDDQVRYKKRFGKDAPKRQSRDAAPVRQREAPQEEAKPAVTGKKITFD
jgi:RNA recognition motif-containing protein